MNKKTKYSEDGAWEDDLPPLDENVAAPDEWVDMQPATDHSAAHKTLEELTAEFLAKGGTITVVEAGIRAEAVTPFNRTYNNFGTPATYSREQFKDHLEKTNRRVSAAREERDNAVAKRLGELLPLKLGKGELLHHVGCSECILQRVIEKHFPNDERALAYRKVSWAERDQKIVERYRELSQHFSLTAISEMVHVRPPRLKKLLAKYGMRA